MNAERFAHIAGSTAYSLAQVAQGLFFHPYQTVQSLVRDRVFFALIFLPSVVWVFAKVVWGFVIVPLVRLAFSCSTSEFAGCDFIPFLTNWLLYFCALWQVMLVYLFVRFSYAFSREKNAR